MTAHQHITAVLIGIAVIASEAQLDRGGPTTVAAMIGELRAIHSAQSTFASSCGRGAYAASVDDLRKPPRGGSSGFIAPVARNANGSYTLTMEQLSDVSPGDTSCNGAAVVSRYFAHVEPLQGVAVPSFAMDESGAIYTRRDSAVISPDFEGAERLK